MTDYDVIDRVKSVLDKKCRRRYFSLCPEEKNHKDSWQIHTTCWLCKRNLGTATDIAAAVIPAMSPRRLAGVLD